MPECVCGNAHIAQFQGVTMCIMVQLKSRYMYWKRLKN